MKNFIEINTDFTDENGVTYIDGYTADSETGCVIGYIINNTIYYTNSDYSQHPLVKELAIELSNRIVKNRD